MTDLYKNAYHFLLRLFTNKETLYTEPIQSDKQLDGSVFFSGQLFFKSFKAQTI